MRLMGCDLYRFMRRGRQVERRDNLQSLDYEPSLSNLIHELGPIFCVEEFTFSFV